MGISIFAILYVLAQGIERTVDVVINFITLLSDSFAESRKRAALLIVNSTKNGNPTEAEIAGTAKATQTVEETRKDLALFAQGLAFALSYALVSYFEFGIFNTIGVENITKGVDRGLTAIAVMGGSKGLHDLISNVQKSKEATETGAK